MTGRLEREKGALHGVSVFKDELKKVRAGIALTFNKHNDGKTKSFRQLMSMHRPRMRMAIQEALETKKSIKIKIRVDIAYNKIVIVLMVKKKSKLYKLLYQPITQ